ncbi:MAG: CPBP family intramembrane metalloprotease [Actinomycetota bacterium]|nr:CPBP family intramembrane metalloprotease [Actinomycetota bacterium]
MTSMTTQQQQQLPSAGVFSWVRHVIVRHPVASYLIMVYAVIFPIALPSALTRGNFLPLDLALYESLGTIFGVTLPAFLVTAAIDGWDGVHELASRCVRWRAGIRWYLIALLGMPVAMTLATTAVFGTPLLNNLSDRWELLFTLVLPQLVLLVLLFNWAEEIGWTGLLQDKLQDRYSPLKACALTAFPFAVFHIPFFLHEEGWALANLPIALVYLVVETFVLFFARVVIIWLYNSAWRSLLIVGLFHAVFNTTVNTFGHEFIPADAAEAGFYIGSGIVVIAAIVIALRTKGRLSYNPDDAAPSAPSRH